MSAAEAAAMNETGVVQAPLNGAGATHVTVPPNTTGNVGERRTHISP